MDLYKKVEQFVQESFLGANETELKHAPRTVFWVKELYPEADQVLLIAAIAHDIERAFRKHELDGIKNNKKGFLNKKYLKYHQEKGAEIVGDFLKKQGAEDNLIDKVKILVSKHEVGGNKEQNILKDADAISFFENNVDYFMEKLLPKVGKKEVKDKLDWTFDKITSGRAKEIVRPWYEKAIKRLAEV